MSNTQFMRGMGIGIAVGAAVGAMAHPRKKSKVAKTIKAVTEVVDNLSDAIGM